MFSWLINRWDILIHSLAQPSIRRMCERNHGLAYLMELSLKKWRESHPISDEVTRDTERLFLNTHRQQWHDCPTCARCHGAVCVISDGGGEHLHCAACGHRFKGTAAEHEQARKADAAWNTFDSESLKETP